MNASGSNGRASEEETVRQRLGELADDLRVVLPGAQVLFAFLLTLPFTSRFSFITSGAEKDVFFVAFMSAVIAAVLLIAPSALHRVYHQLHDPGGLATLLRVASLLAITGASFLALSMAAVVFLITDALYTRPAAAAAAASLLALVAVVWFALPIIHRLRY